MGASSPAVVRTKPYPKWWASGAVERLKRRLATPAAVPPMPATAPTEAWEKKSLGRVCTFEIHIWKPNSTTVMQASAVWAE